MEYRCLSCGCYLDPGEDMLCEDCKQAQKSPGTAATEPGQGTCDSTTNKQIHNNTKILSRGS